MNAPEMTNEERHQMYREASGNPTPKKKMSGSKKGLITLVAIVGGLAFIGAVGDDPKVAEPKLTGMQKAFEKSGAEVRTEPVKPEPVKAQPTETSGQENARVTAEDYLDYTAFSRTGLIDQLKYEGFTTAQATYGAKNAGANWNDQAVQSAKDYLDYSAFSKSGLIEQLEYEGFTAAQAAHGANKAF